MPTLPEQLTPEQAEEVAGALLEASKFLRDAAGPKHHAPSYARSSAKITELLKKFGVEPQ